MIYLQIVGVCWIAIWLHLYFGGPRHRVLPVHRSLRIWSTATLISIFLFYTAFYLPYNVPLTNTFFGGFEFINVVAAILVGIGFSLIIFARQALAHLSAVEVFISLSPVLSTHWIYRYLQHPMYYGIFLVLLGSWLFLPNLFAVLFGIIAFIAIKNKSLIESEDLDLAS